MSKSGPRPYAKMERHLSRRDAILREVIRFVGPCTLRVEPDPFAMLVRSILAQQISSKAAMTISEKVSCLCGKTGLTPRALARATDEELRGCGVSRSKLLSIRGLSDAFAKNPADFHGMDRLTDAAIAERLLPLRGIGPWTVEMFLIFSLGRLDVLPLGDFGLRAGVRDIYGLDEHPGPETVAEIAEAWRPYRTIATWYCWKYRGPVPQS